MRTITHQAQLYFALVYPKQKLSPTQQRECSHAFFAGAEAMFKILDDISRPDVSEDAGVAILEGTRKEIEGYARQMLAEVGFQWPGDKHKEGSGHA